MRDMRLANTTMLGKAVWSMIHKPGKLWVRVLAHKYLRTSSFFQAIASTNASPVWKGLLRARDHLREDLRFRLGDGTSSIWYSDWSGTGIMAESLPFVHVSDSALHLADVIQNGNWDFRRLYTILPPEVGELFMKVQPNLMAGCEDNWIWEDGNRGIYTMKEGYR